jgi:hypothetical protein
MARKKRAPERDAGKAHVSKRHASGLDPHSSEEDDSSDDDDTLPTHATAAQLQARRCGPGNLSVDMIVSGERHDQSFYNNTNTRTTFAVNAGPHRAVFDVSIKNVNVECDESADVTIRFLGGQGTAAPVELLVDQRPAENRRDLRSDKDILAFLTAAGLDARSRSVRTRAACGPIR